MMHKVEKSRHIEGLDYDGGRRKLRVHFKNGTNKLFSGVPSDVYEEMTKCSSVGRYFHNIIKLHYRCEKDDPSET